MKINVDQTVEVSDEQRVQIANVLDGRITRRQATRAEMKEYIWSHGRDWAVELGTDVLELENDEQTSLEDLL